MFLGLLLITAGIGMLIISSLLTAPYFWEAVFNAFSEITKDLSKSARFFIWNLIGWAALAYGLWRIVIAVGEATTKATGAG